MPAFTTTIGASILGALGAVAPMTAGMTTLATGLGVGATAAAGYGAYKGVEALTSKKEESQSTSLPAIQPMPATPTVEASQVTAKSEVEKLKKMRALAGGKTLLTTEAPTLGGGGKTLLGS